MPITRVPKAALSALTAPSPAAPVPLQPIDLSGVARLRVRDVIKLLGIGRMTLYEGMNAGRYPKPDGKDGKMPYWRAATLARFLEK
jgi:hypothetical protein